MIGCSRPEVRNCVPGPTSSLAVQAVDPLCGTAGRIELGEAHAAAAGMARAADPISPAARAFAPV